MSQGQLCHSVSVHIIQHWWLHCLMPASGQTPEPLPPECPGALPGGGGGSGRAEMLIPGQLHGLLVLPGHHQHMAVLKLG